MRPSQPPIARNAARLGIALVLVLLGCSDAVSYWQVQRATKILEPAEAPLAFAILGEYASQGAPLAAQVAALGDDRFRAVFYRGGLPGAGWDGSATSSSDGAWDGSATHFTAPRPAAGVTSATAGGGEMRVGLDTGESLVLPRIQRESPTLGAPPPAGAILLFDGVGASGLAEIDGRVDDRGLLVEGATTRRSFGSFRLHVEFRTPFVAQLDGQGRGNSGIYLQGRYEIQILDSFGLPAAPRGAGSLYDQRAPDVNMSFPPLSWQTYDIDFTAARFDDAGHRVAPARVGVVHNGVRIHDDVAIDGPTGRGEAEGPDPAPILFQDHWHPVRFRNLWVLPR